MKIAIDIDVQEKPTTEGFYAYKENNQELPSIVYLEFRPDSMELYSFAIGFIGGTPVNKMNGKWSEELHLT